MARLVISDGSSSRTVELTDATTVAGRAPENKIVIDDKQASRRHFQIDRVELGFKLVDLESRNGTRVNDRSVNQALLRPGDRIVIGKHVLTFEDPNFKEPPAEVAARLGPPSGAVGRVEAPSSGPDSSSDRPGGLPVAQEVAKPPPAASAPPPPPPPSPDDYRSRRNRSGHTTAVQRNLQGQLQEEQKTLTMVAVGAGVFIFVVLLLIFLPTSPGAGESAATTKAGPKVPSAAEAALAEAEAHDFEELSGYCERNRNVPATYPEIIKRVEQFEQKYPRSLNQAKLKDYKAGALNGLKTSRNAEFSEAEKQASEDLRKNDFAAGMKKIRDLLGKYKADADIHERLVMLKDQAVEDARKYFQTKCLEADAMKSSRRDEAREIYQSLLKTLGNGGVPEFDDYCKIARATLEGLQ